MAADKALFPKAAILPANVFIPPAATVPAACILVKAPRTASPAYKAFMYIVCSPPGIAFRTPPNFRTIPAVPVKIRPTVPTTVTVVPPTARNAPNTRATCIITRTRSWLLAIHPSALVNIPSMEPISSLAIGNKVLPILSKVLCASCFNF